MLTILVTFIYLLAAIDVATPCLTHKKDKTDFNVEAVPLNQLCNSKSGELFQLGVRRSQNSFIPKITLCVDPFKHTTFWTKHSLSKTYPCDEEVADEIIEHLAERPEQNLQKDFELGFLTPTCDFDSEIEQRLTLINANIAPIWKTLRQGNWRNLENFLREEVNENIKSGPFKIITGGFGYRPVEDSSESLIPSYLYKIIVSLDRVERIFVGVNGNEAIDGSVCDDIKDCGWEDQNGTIYCCNLDDSLIERMGLEPENLKY